MGDDSAGGNDGSDESLSAGDDAGGHPIGGTALLKSAALGSVPADRLPELLGRVQVELAPQIDEYRRRYERVESDPGREAFLVERGHWDGVAARLGLSDRERDVVARAHATAVERLGTDAGRRKEFETALEIRSAVVIRAGAETGAKTRAKPTGRNEEE